MKTVTVFTLLVLGLAAATAQPSCRVFKTFNAAANTAMVQDTIAVPDSFPVASAKVTNVVLGFPAVSDLEISLMHRETPEAEFKTSMLKPAVDMVGAYMPETAVPATSAGQWVLRVVDSKPGAEERLISLASWTLQLCAAETAPVTAAGGEKDASIEVAVEVSKDGEKHDDDKHDGEKRAFKVGDSAKGMLGLLFPGLKDEDVAPDGVLGHIHAVADHTRDNAVEHVSDALKLVADSSDLYKGYVAKKISDTISDINKAGTYTIGMFKGDGEKFSLHDKTLIGFIANLKAFVAAEVHATIEAILKTAGDLPNVHGALTGHFKSSAGSVAELVAAGLSNMGSLYLTVEGAAKTHMNGFITAKATVLESLLDKIIAALEHVEDSKLTGHVVDIGIKINVAKLEALAKALDMVEEAAKKLPTPSQFITGKFGVFTSIIKQTHVYDLLTSVGDADRPIIDGLMGKVGTARELLKKATPIVAASNGN